MAAMRLDQIYMPSSSDKVLELEKDLEQELAELKAELEENEMHHGIAPKITGYVCLELSLNISWLCARHHQVCLSSICH